MKKRISLSMTAALAAMLFLAESASAQSLWTKQTAPVMTPWGEELTEENVWPEYPRPSMKRQEWMNLNGVWQYFKRSTISYDYENRASAFSKAILVPFPVESALSGIMDKSYYSNRKATHMYRRTFTLPEAFSGKSVLLHFGAVDWRCYVYVNGQLAGTHDGGSVPFSFDITPLLKEGEQELQVAVWDPTDGGQPNGKQSVSPSGIWYTPNSGIWQTVWLEPVSPTHVLSYEPIPDIDGGTVSVKVNTSAPCSVTLTARDGDIIVAKQTGSSDETFTLSIPSAKLWSPDEPNLYDLDITLSEQGQETDRVRGYFGMRKFSRGMVDGHPAVLLNNKPLYMYGPLDQGWWPDGLLTPPSYEAMVYDLQVMKDFGMNMVRKHIKLENDLWFEWCDRNGLVVWQDMPSGCGSGAIGNIEYAMQNFYRENEALIDATRQHPCIGAWVVINEGWGQHTEQGMGHTHRAVNSVINANHDPGRFVHAVTGWTDVEMGDFLDVHSYPSPGAATNPVNERVASCGEFGGINLFIDGHMWAGSDVNYTTVEDADTYTNLYDHYTDRLQELQKEKGLWMSVYTQITDVEQECNGILTYDRKVLKVSPEQQAAMKANILRTVNSRYKDAKTIVPAGDEASGIQWKYTLTEPASDDWYAPDFDAAGWRTGTAGFGGGGRTSWTSSDIWIRRSFKINNFDASRLQDLRLWLFHDEDAEIYINGKLTLKVTGYNTKYEQWPLLPEGLQSLKLDGSDNVIAIHCKQTTGGQFIDCGLKMRNYTPNDGLQVDPMPEKTPAPEFATDGDKAYLMSYTLPTSSELHYAYSLDGAKWTTVNGNRPVLSGEYAGLELKAPFIRRVTTDGKDIFHLVAGYTDNSQPGFYHLQSEDLVNWTAGESGNIRVKPSNSDLYKAESPEWIYNEAQSMFYIYWSAKNGDKNSVCLTTTKNWKTFMSPRVLYSTTYSVYDMHLEKTGDTYTGIFYNSDRNLCQMQTSVLKTSGTIFSEPQRIFSSQIPRSRAPQTFPALDGTGWFLLYKSTERSRQAMSRTGNVAECKWYPCNEYELSLPDEAQEGSVLVITREELANILDNFFYEECDVLPTAEKEPQMWKYQTASSVATNTSWTKPNYSETSWKDGLSGFGASNPPGSFVNTTWNSSVIRLRYHLDLTGYTPEQMNALAARIHHDEDVTVYFNGVIAFQESGYLTAYKNIPINQEALDALMPDDTNVIAIECTNKGGGQYIDFGLTGIRPIPTGIKETESEQLKRTNGIGKEGAYNLQGQMIGDRWADGKGPHGINIIGGKKILR